MIRGGISGHGGLDIRTGRIIFDGKLIQGMANHSKKRACRASMTTPQEIGTSREEREEIWTSLQDNGGISKSEADKRTVFLFSHTTELLARQ